MARAASGGALLVRRLRLVARGVREHALEHAGLDPRGAVGPHAVVTLVLQATDRSPRGLVKRSFDVRWELTASGRGWVADTLSATPRATRG